MSDDTQLQKKKRGFLGMRPDWLSNTEKGLGDPEPDDGSDEQDQYGDQAPGPAVPSPGPSATPLASAIQKGKQAPGQNNPVAAPEPPDAMSASYTGEPQTSSSERGAENRSIQDILAQKGRAARSALNEYQALSNDPQWKRSAPPDTQRSLAEALNKARELYTQKTDRNDWLAVAQMLGQAGAQYAAAQSGMKSGRNMAELPFGKGIDYEAANDRALKEYELSGRNAENQGRNAREAYEDVEKGKGEEFRRKEDYAKANVGETSKELAEEEAYKRALTRDARFSQAETDRMTRAEKQAKAKQLADDMKDTKKDKDAAIAGAQIAAEDLAGDMSPKALSAMKAKHPHELGLLDQADLDAAKQAATEPGAMWGTNVNPDKFKQAITEKVSRKYDERLSNLRDALSKVWGPEQQQGQAPAGSNSKTLSQKDLKDYVDLHKVSEDEARKFLQSQGYTIQ